MRLIDADALLKKAPNVCKVTEYDETGCGISYLAVPVEAIKNAPTVDAVEVVRCKDCVDYNKADRYQYAHCRLCGSQREEDDFCSYGERRKQNATD
jgi:hypothetical protein